MIWIIGAKGMLGQELCLAMDKAELTNVGTDKEVDILSPQILSKKAEEISPDWIINCSAYTAVDQAEGDVDLAYKINRDGVENLAKLSSELDIPIIHISTDYVFDGSSSIPLAEDAATGPIGVYGKSKLAGEEVLQKNNNKFFIIRTAWLYGQFGPNFVYTMIKLMNKLDGIKVVDDQIGTPTWARDLTDLISTIIKSECNQYGIYHFSGEGQCSWFDFASEIYRLGRDHGVIDSLCEINPCNTDEFPTKAKRPAFSLLSKDKIKETFSFVIEDWKKSLQRFISNLNEDDII